MSRRLGTNSSSYIQAGGDLVFLQKVNKKSSASHETRPDERKTAAWEARNKGIRDKGSGLDSQ